MIVWVGRRQRLYNGNDFMSWLLFNEANHVGWMSTHAKLVYQDFIKQLTCKNLCYRHLAIHAKLNNLHCKQGVWRVGLSCFTVTANILAIYTYRWQECSCCSSHSHMAQIVCAVDKFIAQLYQLETFVWMVAVTSQNLSTNCDFLRIGFLWMVVLLVQ